MVGLLHGREFYMRETSAARFYELMVITAPEGTPEELMATVDQITGYITTAGGSILRSNSDSPWGRRRLAYPIRYQSTDVRDGFYTLIHLEMAPDKVIEVERDLKLNDRLMRYMVIQLDGEPVFPEPVEEEEEAPEGAEAEAPAAGTEPDAEVAAEVTETAVAEAAPEPESSEATADERRTLVAEEAADEVAEAAASEESADPDAEAAESKE